MPSTYQDIYKQVVIDIQIGHGPGQIQISTVPTRCPHFTVFTPHSPMETFLTSLRTCLPVYQCSSTKTELPNGSNINHQELKNVSDFHTIVSGTALHSWILHWSCISIVYYRYLPTYIKTKCHRPSFLNHSVHQLINIDYIWGQSTINFCKY